MFQVLLLLACALLLAAPGVALEAGSKHDGIAGERCAREEFAMAGDEATSSRTISVPAFTAGSVCMLLGAQPMPIGMVLMSRVDGDDCRRQRLAAITGENRRGRTGDKLPSPVAQKIDDKSRAIARPGDSYRRGVDVWRPAP
jgi:hypothetical protein